MILFPKQNSKASRGLVRLETVTNQHSGFLIGLSSCLRIKYALEPLQADLGVDVPGFRAGIVPSRGGECSSVTSVSSSWPDNH